MVRKNRAHSRTLRREIIGYTCTQRRITRAHRTGSFAIRASQEKVLSCRANNVNNNSAAIHARPNRRSNGGRELFSPAHYAGRFLAGLCTRRAGARRTPGTYDPGVRSGKGPDDTNLIREMKYARLTPRNEQAHRARKGPWVKKAREPRVFGRGGSLIYSWPSPTLRPPIKYIIFLLHCQEN